MNAPALHRHPIVLAAPAIAATLVIYWQGLHAWFQADDFAWLSLPLEVETPSDLLNALFSPRAQGTIRPWSERGFFLLFERLFGWHPLPFHAWVFLTQFVNLVLLASVARRVTGLALAGLAAPLIWTTNAALGEPLSWTSAYNEILCTTFLLAAFRLFLAYTETGDRRFYWAQWAVFLLGFGALELNVMYPALAFAWALLACRRYLVATLPLFAASLAYTVAHNYAAPTPQEGVYAMHFDAALISTLGEYLKQLSGWRTFGAAVAPPWMRIAGTVGVWLAAGALLAFTAWKLARGRWAVLFPFAWFLAMLAPVLPLRDHVSNYYLVTPAIGFALLAGWAFAEAWRRSPAGRAVALLLAAGCLLASVPIGHAYARFYSERGAQVRDMVLGVVRARELHPGKLILLAGVGSDRFWAGVMHRPFRALGMQDVYLAPGADSDIEPHPEYAQIGDYVLPPGPALQLLKQGQAVVYDVSGPLLRNVTNVYAGVARHKLKPGLAGRIEVGHPAFESQIGSGWFPSENRVRWMGGRAVVWLRGPEPQDNEIVVEGYCPASQLGQGPLLLTATIEGHRQSPVPITQPDQVFSARFALPAGLPGAQRIEVALEVNHMVPGPDGAPRGVVVTTVAFR